MRGCICIHSHLMLYTRDREEQRDEEDYMPVARLYILFIDIKKNEINKNLGFLSAAVSFPSSQTALPSLSGLPDMLITM